MTQHTTPREDYNKIVKQLKETGEANHNGLTFELDDVCNLCEVYDSSGEFLFYLENVTDIYEYC